MLNMWELTIIETYDDGYLLMSPNGDTQYITQQQYSKLKELGKLQNGTDCTTSSKEI